MMSNVAMRVIKQKIKDIVLNVWFPIVYRKAAKKPLDQGKVLFVEAKEIELPGSFELLYQSLNSLYDVEFVSLRKNNDPYPRYCLNCVDMLKKAAMAQVVFLNDASDVISCVPLRTETKVVQLWHACGAFKKWGMSTADLKFGGTREEKRRHPFYENLSLVTVSSPDVVWAYAEAMDLEDKLETIKPLGVSRTDVFFDKDYLSEAYSAVKGAVPAISGKKVLLYAPTFRGQASEATAPDKLDIPAFQEALSDKYVLLIKHHPFVKHRPAIPEECRNFAYDVSNDLSIDKLLSVADVCISDYSSLIFEYSLFERPLVFFAYDKEEYDDWRGFYYDYDELTPGPVFYENAAMIDYLCHIDERFDRSDVSTFRDRFMSSCDGRATERIVAAVFGDMIA